jgi:hypothetical protein
LPWKLPVPSTGVVTEPHIEVRLGRVVGIAFTYESPVDGTLRACELVLDGVEAYKVTYFKARGEATSAAYDEMIDCGATEWLRENRENLRANGGDSKGLRHLMINFDDGPAYEFICRSFAVKDEPAGSDAPE